MTHGAVEVSVTGIASLIVSGPGGSEQGDVGVIGEIAIDMPDCGPGVLSCTATLTYFRVDSAAVRGLSGTLNVAGETASRIRVINLQPLPDHVRSDDGVVASFEFLPGGSFFASADVMGADDGRPSIQLTNSDEIFGLINWTTREIVLFANMMNDDGSARIVVVVDGTIASLPPTANVSPPQTVECAGPAGTPATLSAAASTDPDGPEDIVRTVWSGDLGGVERNVGSGTEVEVIAPLGHTGYAATVVDRAGQADVASTSVDVVDTTGPVFADVAIEPDCLWPPNHGMHLFRLGEEITASAVDECSGDAATVRIVEVLSDEAGDARGDGSTEPDVQFGSGAVCLRAERSGKGRGRTYTVVLEAEDAGGVTTQSRVHVRVPHDQRRASRCAHTNLPTVDDDDARCTAEVVEVTAHVAAPLATPAPGACSVSDARTRGPGTGVWSLIIAVMGLASWRRWRR